MRDYTSTTTPDHIEEAETAIGTQPLGRPGKILIVVAILIFGSLIGGLAFANAAAGLPRALTSADGIGQTYDDSVPAEIFVTANGTIGVRGHAGVGGDAEIVLQQIHDTDTPSQRERSLVASDGTFSIPEIDLPPLGYALHLNLIVRSGKSETILDEVVVVNTAHEERSSN